MKTTVIHIRNKAPGDVYIGRPGKWGNPFAMKDESQRDAAVEQHKRWLWEQMKAGKITRDELLELDGKRLVCYCAPKRCHGDNLVAAIEYLKTREAVKNDPAA